MATPSWEFAIPRRLQLAGVAIISAGVTAGVILSAQKLIRRERVRKLKESIPIGDERIEEKVRQTTPATAPN
jgi:hypothetical protein